MIRRSLVYHPLAVLATSLAAGFGFALLVSVRYTGGQRAFLLYYFAPIAVPFTAYLLDRAERRRTLRPVQWATDAVAVGLALVRAFTLVPLISGHALFLTYALLTARSWPVRATAAAVMLQVACLKLFAWHDMTLFGGIVVGSLAALAFAHTPGARTVASP